MAAELSLNLRGWREGGSKNDVMRGANAGTLWALKVSLVTELREINQNLRYALEMFSLINVCSM